MAARTIEVTLKGVTPLLHNRDDIMFGHEDLKKTKQESYEEHEIRIWKDKAHVNKDGQLIFPDTWIRKMLISSQGLTANPIKPPNASRKTMTMKPYFVSGILVDSTIICNKKGKPVVLKDLEPMYKMVSPQGKGKVLCIRPMIPAEWQVTVSITLTVEMVRDEHILESLAWAGTFNGAGDWRPQKGGNYGIFDVYYKNKHYPYNG